MAKPTRDAGAAAPPIETERLLLRGHRLSDFDALAATWADPAVVRHISGTPSSPGDSWARLLRYAGHWALLGYGFWALEERSTGRFVGEVGFGDFRRAIDPPITAPEMGWVLSPWAHGKGYATEAARAACAWGLAHFGPVEIACIIDPDNEASIRVAEKVGFREKLRTTYLGGPTVLFTSTLG
ncbi:MAG TPA: GNAT family N-acetyltransferase [Polyangiaceae bacterium]|nr:GNAT family N-acetyltransferase [Polyangiaceae bacterium]